MPNVRYLSVEAPQVGARIDLLDAHAVVNVIAKNGKIAINVKCMKDSSTWTEHEFECPLETYIADIDEEE